MFRESKKEHEEHARLLKAFEKFRKNELEEFRSYLQSPGKIFFSNFLAGTARGLGFLFGAAIVIALVTYVTKEILANIPIIGDFSLALQKWIEETLKGVPK